MRTDLAALFCFLFALIPAAGQSTGPFSGTWKLNPARSEIRSLPQAPDPVLQIEHTEEALKVTSSGGSARTIIYPLNGKELRNKTGNTQTSIATKWEGSALLTSILVSGSQNYSLMERWKTNRDSTVLTIKRTVVRMGSESESLLVYENTAAAPPPPAEPAPVAPRPVAPPPTPAPAPEPEPEFTIDAGTRIPLNLLNPVNTKAVAPGDRVYLQTTYPILSKGKIIIPAGSYVNATVASAERAGRVKGRASLHLRFESISLPNGVSRNFQARVGSTEASVDRKEGTIHGDSNKGGDARTVGSTTAAGAGIGGLAGSAAGHAGMGAGIGAAAGAAGGLIGVLSRRGPDVVLPKGTSFELVLEHPLVFKTSELTTSR